VHSKKQKKSYPRRRKKVARKVEKKFPNKLKKKSPNKLKKRVPKSAEVVTKMTSIFGSKKLFFLRENWGTERSLEKETVDTFLRRFCAPQGLPIGELPSAAIFFFGYSFEEINLRVENL